MNKLRSLLFVVAAVCACGADEGPLEGRRTSKHFELRFQPGDPRVCDDELPRLEDHYRVLHDVLGRRRTDERIEYFKYPLDLDPVICEDRPACSVERQVHSFFALDEHELVHAYLYDSANAQYPPSFLNEGAAVALSLDPPSFQSPVSSSTLERLRSTNMATLLYSSAGFDGDEYLYFGGSVFVGRLIDRYGVTATLDFVIASAQPGDVAQQFASRFDGTMEDFYRAAVTEPVPAVYPFLPISLCATSPRLAIGEATVLSAGCRTDRPTAVFSIDVAATMQLDVLGGFELFHCSRIAPAVTTGQSRVRVALEAGDYLVRARQDSTLTVLASPDMPLSTSCAAAESRRFADVATTGEIDFAFASDPVNVRYFAVGGPQTRLSVIGMRVQICPTCDSSATSCMLVDGSPGVASYEGDGDYVVVIPPEPTIVSARWLSLETAPW